MVSSFLRWPGATAFSDEFLHSPDVWNLLRRNGWEGAVAGNRASRWDTTMGFLWQKMKCFISSWLCKFPGILFGRMWAKKWCLSSRDIYCMGWVDRLKWGIGFFCAFDCLLGIRFFLFFFWWFFVGQKTVYITKAHWNPMKLKNPWGFFPPPKNKEGPFEAERSGFEPCLFFGFFSPIGKNSQRTNSWNPKPFRLRLAGRQQDSWWKLPLCWVWFSRVYLT